MSVSVKDFVPIDKLGQGSFASVYKVRRLTDQKIYAIKKIRMSRLDKRAKENALNEVRLLASLESPYIVTYHQAFFDESLDALCIVMEYAEGGDLRKMIKKYQDEKKIVTQIEIWKLFIHLLYGLNILHEKKILHRDLKSQNIFVCKSIYKIGDMNVSKINKEGFAQTQTGTPYYASPQVWKDEPYNQKSDIWSVGCILYELAALKPPFVGKNMGQLYKNILKGQFLPLPKYYSNELVQVISSCLKINPQMRPSVADLKSNCSVKIYENICVQYEAPSAYTQSKQLLKTIMMPKNMKQLNQFLPKSNYNTQKIKAKQNLPFLDKNHQFLQIETKQEIKIVSQNSPQKQNIRITSQKENQSPSQRKNSKKKSLRKCESKIAIKFGLQNQNYVSLKEFKDSKQQLTESIPKDSQHIKPFSEQVISKKSEINNREECEDELQGYDRMIHKIKAKAYQKSKAAVLKKRNEKPRRCLNFLDNSNQQKIKIRSSRSKSLRRTESKSTRQNKDKQISDEIKLRCLNQLDTKKERIQLGKSLGNNKLSQRSKMHIIKEKETTQKCQYWKIIEQAKSVLEKSHLKKKKA